MWKPRKYTYIYKCQQIFGALVEGNWKKAMEIFRMMIMYYILIMMSVTQV